MTDLTTRLLAVIEETERIARVAIAALEDDEAAEWKASNVYGDDSGHPTEFDVWFGYIPDDSTIVRFYVQHSDVARHIACHDPASVLRRCAADRKIVELHGVMSDFTGPGCGSCGDWDHAVSYEITDPLPFPCPTLLALADGYGITGEDT